MLPKIQLAMDTFDSDQALWLAHYVHRSLIFWKPERHIVNLTVIGIFTTLKKFFPDKLILADFKSSDIGAYEANMAFEAGADVVKTQRITTYATICEFHKQPDQWKRRAEVDMKGVIDPVKELSIATNNNL